MIEYFLCAESHDALFAVLERAGVVQRVGEAFMTQPAFRLAVLGELQAPATTDQAGDHVPGAPIAGYHANLRSHLVDVNACNDLAFILKSISIAAPRTARHTFERGPA